LPFVIGSEIDIEKIAKSIEEICEKETKKRRKFPYDSLIIATGGIPRVPLLLRAVLNG